MEALGTKNGRNGGKTCLPRASLRKHLREAYLRFGFSSSGVRGGGRPGRGLARTCSCMLAGRIRSTGSVAVVPSRKPRRKPNVSQLSNIPPTAAACWVPSLHGSAVLPLPRRTFRRSSPGRASTHLDRPAVHPAPEGMEACRMSVCTYIDTCLRAKGQHRVRMWVCVYLSALCTYRVILGRNGV